MQLAGSPSWRLSLDNPQTLDIALFVRDSVGLVAPPRPEVPPAFAARVSDHTAVLTDPARIQAGEQWLEWWGRLIAYEITPRPDPGADMRQRLTDYQRVMDPPDFDSLADLPALRTAVTTIFSAAAGWLSVTRRQATDRLHLDHALVRDVVADVIAEHGVRPDQLDAAIIVLEVAGAWSHLAGPGAMFCSANTFSDPVSARAVLREALVTSLDR